MSIRIALFFMLVMIFASPASRASMVDFSTCVKEAGTNSYIYGRVDEFGRVGPYNLAVKDMFAIGVCTGEGRLYGTVNDWSLCNFKGSLASGNSISSMNGLVVNSELQDLYFSIITSVIHEKEVVDLFNLKGLSKYHSYPQWQETLTGIAYRKGTKALRYHALFKMNVLDHKGDRQSLIEQLDKMQKCGFVKNNVRGSDGRKQNAWLDFKPVPPDKKVKRFMYVFPKPDITKKLSALVKADPDAKIFNGIFEGDRPTYMYSEMDYDGNDINDYIVLVLSDEYKYNNMPYYIVIHDEGKKIDTFPANDIGYAGNKLVINGLQMND